MDWLPFVGILVALVSVGIALAGLILVTTQRMRTDMRAEMKALEERLNKRIDEGLGTLSGQVDKLSERVSRLEERQAHTAGLIEGLRDSLFDRARRVERGERVAEDGESYEAEG